MCVIYCVYERVCVCHMCIMCVQVLMDTIRKQSAPLCWS